MIDLQTMPLRFRVWDTCSREWVRPYGREDWPGEKPYIFALGNMLQRLGKTINWLDGTRFIISQDTGLKDKNGRSIFTGDIVKHDRSCLIPAGVIHYNQRSSKIVYNEFNDGLYNSEKLIEVVGNIWQNPELLEEKQP